MRSQLAVLTLSSLMCAALGGCDLFLDLEPDDPPPMPEPNSPDAAPPEPPADAAPPMDAPSDPPPDPPEAPYPGEPVVIAPTEPPADIPPPDGSVTEGVHIAFPPTRSVLDQPRLTVRGTARITGGVGDVRVNGASAWLSSPNADGAVAWRVELTAAIGPNELTVQGYRQGGLPVGDDSAVVEFAPYMLISPNHASLDVDSDRLYVSDTGAKTIVAFDLETGLPTLVNDGMTPDGPLSFGPMAAAPEAGVAVALFLRGTSDYEGYEGEVLLGLDQPTQTVLRDTGYPSYCDDCGDLTTQTSLLLNRDAPVNRYVYATDDCDSNSECHAFIRLRGFGDAPPEPSFYTICDASDCSVPDVIHDERASTAGFPLLVLVVIDEYAEVRALDADTGQQAPLFAFPSNITDPFAMALDAERERLYVLARVSDAPGKHLYAVDLDGGDPELLHSYDPNAGDPNLGYKPKMLYDPKRDRLLLVDDDVGVLALDPTSGAVERLFRADFGPGPAPECGNGCGVSNLDRTRNRLFTSADDQIFEVDLTTGERSILSEKNRDGIFLFSSTVMCVDAPEDRLLVLRGNSLYSVDGTTGARGLALTTSANPADAACDPERRRIVYFSNSTHELRVIDLATGLDEVVASDSLGDGAVLDSYRDLALSESGKRAFLSHIDLEEDISLLIEVSVVTGNRAQMTLAEPFRGFVPFSGATPVIADTRRDRLLIGRYPHNAISSLDLRNEALDFMAESPSRFSPGRVHPDFPDDRAVIQDGKDVTMFDLQTGERVWLMRDMP